MPSLQTPSSGLTVRKASKRTMEMPGRSNNKIPNLEKFMNNGQKNKNWIPAATVVDLSWGMYGIML